MSDGISIFDVIKRGGYEASLITTFNATLPFYEEVVLRKLVGAGCRHNVVLMDRQQCALAWESEASRPRLAGYAYTLLPVGVAGAFHPKVCLLLGPKKASILIGSHNLTLSGFGYNREVSNWIEVAGAKDVEGTALLNAVWQMVRQWIELERDTAPEPLLESALATANFVAPLLANSSATLPKAVALAQTPGRRPLVEQLAEQIPPGVKRIGVIGAFFDGDQAFIKELQQRWPATDLVIGIDPESVHLPGTPDTSSPRYVDVRPLWQGDHGYLHAKALFFDTGVVATNTIVSGSANPSRPAWMATAISGNVEAVLLHTGVGAVAAAETMGLPGMFDLPTIAPDIFESIVRRSADSNHTEDPRSIPIWTGVADADTGELRIFSRGKPMDIIRATLLGPNMDVMEETERVAVMGSEIVFRPSIELARIRSCILTSGNQNVVRAMILHPSVLSASSRSSRQYQIRSALSALGSSDSDISKVIATVEKVIFADEVTREVEVAVREHQERRAKVNASAGPESLAISVADMPNEKKKVRLLKSGDLAYLIDVLLRRLSEGLETQSIETDSSGRTEEEQIGKDDGDVSPPAEQTTATAALNDCEIARAVARRARTLIRKMIGQLKLAATDESRRAGAVIQLVAVLALVRELRHLDKTPRWRSTGQSLAEEEDRRYLLDESVKYLLSPTCRLIDVPEKAAGETTEEASQLRVLLLWLAWDLGEELTEQIGRIWDARELRAKLQANAVFLELMPAIAEDDSARGYLKESISRTIRSTPEASMRAAEWLERHIHFGRAWSKGFRECDILQVGGYCHVPGNIDEPHVIVELTDSTVGFWDYERVRKFERSRVVGLAPAKT